MPKTKTYPLSLYDIYISAFLDYQGVKPTLIKEGTRIEFCFPNDETVHKLMTLYNSNPSSIPLLDYIAHLRKLRSQMLSMRG